MNLEHFSLELLRLNLKLMLFVSMDLGGLFACCSVSSMCQDGVVKTWPSRHENRVDSSYLHTL